MKRSWHLFSFELLLFIGLLAGSFLLVKPLSEGLETLITDFRDDLTNKIESETGLRLRYESMSPSILQSLQITNLEILDPASGTVLALIDNVAITYNILKVISGNPSIAIERIELNNGYFKFSLEENSDVLGYFQGLIGEPKQTNQPKVNSSFLQDISNTEIVIHNISFEYIDPIQSLSLFVSIGTVGIIEEDFNYNLKTKFEYSNPSLTELKDISGNITINGSLHRSLTNGISTVLLQSFDSSLINVSRLSLFMVYNSGTLTLNTVQDLQPVDIQLTWDTRLKRIDARLQCERLLPLKWIRLKNENPILTHLSESEISGVFHLIKEHDVSPVLDYEIDALIPSSFYGGAKILSKGLLSGDDFDLQSLTVQGKNVSISSKLVYDYKEVIPEGFASVKKLHLPDGTFFSGDIYFTPNASGFSCIIPILTVNTASYSSLNIDFQYDVATIDITFSAFDSTGKITAEASLSRNAPYFIQGYVALDSLSLFDTITLLQGVLAQKDTSDDDDSFFHTYAMTTEVYFSSDFSDVSFNCPRLVVAPLTSGEEYLLLSAKGNLEEIELFDIQYVGSGLDANGSVFAGFAKTGDIIFNSSLLVNSIPFDFSGLFSNSVLSLYGDYSLAASVLFDVVGGISGSIQTKGFPVFLSNSIFSVSLDAGFIYKDSEKWKITADSVEIEEVTGLLPLETSLSFKGYADFNGVFLPEVVLSDGYSLLDGSASLSIMRNTDLGTRYIIDCNLDSQNSTEYISLSATLTGKEELFIESIFSVNSFPLMRLLSDQQNENIVTMDGTISGTIDTLFATVYLNTIRYRMFDFDLEAYGSIVLEDNHVSLFDAGGFWNGNSFSNLLGSLDLSLMQAEVTTDWNAVLGSHQSGAKLLFNFDSYDSLSVNEEYSKSFLVDAFPNKFSVSATVENLKFGTLFVERELQATVIHEPGITALYAGENDSILGYLFDDGTFSLSSAIGNILEFEADGSIENTHLNIQVSNIHSDLSQLWNLTTLDFLSIKTGELNGNFIISGLLNDPDFQGEIEVSNLFFTVPGYLDKKTGPVQFSLFAEGKEMFVPIFKIPALKGSLDANAEVLFDRWIPVSLSSHIESSQNQAFNIDIENEFVKASGILSTNIDLLLTDDVLSLKGKATYEEGFLSVVFSGFNKQNTNSVAFNKHILLDLEFSVGKKVEFRWQPGEITVIRGLIQAEKPLFINVDTSSSTFQIKGKAGLRGGEVFYLKRNFYLREGSVYFNENQDLFDPFITLRAEVRERDAQGNPVRIILSVENQPLSNFSPILTSDPIRSEVDIIALLGQVTSGDMTRDNLLRDVIVTSSDLLTQLSLFRNTENAIRDFLNLDLFSIRTLVLQNAILGQSLQTYSDKPLTIGNYFDNTTVYMGKYVGSAIYADALLHFSYFDPRLKANSESLIAPYGNLLFQPELGVEVNTPLFLLRWSFSPENKDTLFVADNSITLSWKFSY